MHNYESTHKVFPGAYNTSRYDGSRGGNWGSWSPQAMMLTFMEQGAIYNACNFFVLNQGAAGTGRESNTTVVVTRIGSFLCPSSPLPQGNLGAPWSAQRPGNNYFGSVGSSIHYDGTAGTSAPNGVFRYNGSPIGISDITDGTSNTIACGEWKTGDFDVTRLSRQDVAPVGATYINGGTATNNPAMNMPYGGGALPGYLKLCNSALAAGTTAQPSGNRSTIAEIWAPGMPARSLGNVVLAPNPPYNNCVSCAIPESR